MLFTEPFLPSAHFIVSVSLEIFKAFVGCHRRALGSHGTATGAPKSGRFASFYDPNLIPNKMPASGLTGFS